MNDLNLTPIQQFYNNSNIFITGASGFLGKILLEKLLRSCPNVCTIYILVREKKGKNLKTRVEEILADVPFKVLTEKCPNFKDKVIGIYGDCSLPNLGLSLNNIEVLKREVNIIFHLAATVRFTEKLKTATFINIRATKDLLNIAREMPNLKVMLHVSTTFANCIHKVIEEEVYPPAFDGDILITMAEKLSDDTFDKFTNTLLGEYPNTYTFTKQIAETIVEKNGIDLPVGIHRPAVAVSTYREPIKFWINNTYSVTGVVAYTGLGIVRILAGSRNSKSTMVPVDMCMNSVIASAWDVGTSFEIAKKQKQKFEMPVYHYESNNDKPIEWGQILYKSLEYGLETPSSKTQWYPYFIIQSNLFIYNIYVFFLHLLPAFILDLIFFCFGKSPTMLKMYTKIYQYFDVISYFCYNDWTYKSNNIRKLIDKMTEKDKNIFFCDLKQLNWEDFLKRYFYGIRLYVLKDPEDTLPKARARLRRFYWAHRMISLGVVVLFLYMLLYFLYKNCIFKYIFT